MTGNPIQQKFRVTIETNVGSKFGFLGTDYSVVDYLNTAISNNGLLGALKAFFPQLGAFDMLTWDAILTIDLQVPLATKGVTQSVFAGSHWIEKNGHCALQTNLFTVSDPISTNDIIALIIGAALIFTAVALFLIGVTGWGIALIAIVGAIIILGVTVDIIGSSAGNLLAFGLGILGVIVILGFGIPVAMDAVRGKKKSPKRTRKS